MGEGIIKGYLARSHPSPLSLLSPTNAITMFTEVHQMLVHHTKHQSSQRPRRPRTIIIKLQRARAQEA